MTDLSTGLPDGIDPQRPSAARVYDFMLGGTHNFASDRAAAAAAVEVMPQLPAIMKLNRAFLRAAVATAAADGLDQFIDLGSGIPTVGTVHEIARQHRPRARVVYVDVDPIAVIHSREILAGDPDSAVLQANLLDADTILADSGLRSVIDFSRPVGLLLVAVAHFLADTASFLRALRTYQESLAPGSLLILSHASAEGSPESAEKARQVYNRTTSPLVLRGRDDLRALLAGWRLREPGVVSAAEWLASAAEPSDARAVDTDPVAARSVLVAIAERP
ncbi:MAG TPA: SAM-dependent methyltransferase [Pilimelia sp.]|nr:SAM-dependent methyltransferase [Pilimelia sp.]